jgi:hypothetical protein
MAAIARRLNAYRLAACALVLLTLGHTLGAVVNTPHLGPAGDAIAEAMKQQLLTAEGWPVTWYGFFRGFGVIVSVFLVLAAAQAWFLGGLTGPERLRLALVTWGLFVALVANALVAWVYFFPVAFGLAFGATLLFGLGIGLDLAARRSD